MIEVTVQKKKYIDNIYWNAAADRKVFRLDLGGGGGRSLLLLTRGEIHTWPTDLMLGGTRAGGESQRPHQRHPDDAQLLSLHLLRFISRDLQVLFVTGPPTCGCCGRAGCSRRWARASGARCARAPRPRACRSTSGRSSVRSPGSLCVRPRRWWWWCTWQLCNSHGECSRKDGCACVCHSLIAANVHHIMWEVLMYRLHILKTGPLILISIYTDIYIYIYRTVTSCMFIYIYMYIQEVTLYVYTYICIYICIYTCVYRYIYIHTYINTRGHSPLYVFVFSIS